MSRTRCGGDITGSYDGQVADASHQLVGNGQAAVNFGTSYYDKHVAPLLDTQNKQANTSATNLNNVADTDAGVQGSQANLATGLGATAQKNFYDMAANYNSPEEFERQAMLARGDVGQAEANQEQATQQRRAALGIDPTSGAAQVMGQQNQVQNTATEAMAMNNARNAARSLGMQLSQTAAQQGTQNVNNAISAGQGAGAAATGAFGVASGNTGTAGTVGQQQQTAFQTGNQAFGQNMSNYTNLDNTSIQQNGQNSIGSTLGSLAGTALSAYTGGSAGSAAFRGGVNSAFGKAGSAAKGLVSKFTGG